jgi:hypothetical protein
LKPMRPKSRCMRVPIAQRGRLGAGVALIDFNLQEVARALPHQFILQERG